MFPTFWGEFDAIVGVMALGIVVRLAGPLASDKRTDPAVVVVDDAGRFAVSVLGGHGAGANELARDVARVLGATPVVTTASEARGLPAVDLVGRDLGWKIERAENLTRVAAAVVRGQTVAVWQDAGATDWWRPFGAWPENFVRLERLGRPRRDRPGRRPGHLRPGRARRTACRPTGRSSTGRRRSWRGSAASGGRPARRSTPGSITVFSAHGLAPGSLAAVATVTLKADEPGLIAFAAGRGVPLVAFPPEELADQPGIETPSERVRSKIGIAAVAEPAALRAAGAAKLLVTKQKGPGVTVAVARRGRNEEFIRR